MGHTSSQVKVQAEVTVPAGLPLVDALSLSCSTARCWGRGKLRLARYTFPRHSWVSCQGRQVCRSKELRKLPLDKLNKEDASTAVKVKCILRGAPVFAATVPLARLLALGEGAARGGAALLLFSLAGGEDAAAERGAAYTTLSCSGRLCGSGGNTGEDGGQGDAECPSHWEDDCGAPASPGTLQLVEGHQKHAPAHCGGEDLPPTSQDPATASLALGADDRPLAHPAQGPTASGGTRSHRQLTAVELWCPVWQTPTCEMEVRAKADAGLPSARVPAFVAEPQLVTARLPDTAQTLQVPRVHCADPSASAQDAEVPEVDLGESTTLALYRELHKNDPEPEPFVGQDAAAPQTELGELPSLECHDADPDPESSAEVPPPGAQDREAAAAEDFAPGVQEEESLRSGKLWGGVILDILAVLHLCVFFCSFLYAFWS